MWFIIIFGSIPVLRPFFIRFGQTIRTSTGDSSEGNRRSVHRSTGRSKNDTWVPLSDRGTNRVTCDSSAVYNPHDAESEENILPGRSRGGLIMVTRDIEVSAKDVI